jgi:ribosomal protein L7/L12
MVEKAPVVLKQNMKKEDIEPIKKKLEENGGVIKLI